MEILLFSSQGGKCLGEEKKQTESQRQQSCFIIINKNNHCQYQLSWKHNITKIKIKTSTGIAHAILHLDGLGFYTK